MKLLKKFGGADDANKSAHSTRAGKSGHFDEDKHRDLLDDDYFAVDNGIDKLEIFELGITETRDPAKAPANAPLQDKVHFKSEISGAEALEIKRARAEAMFAEVERQEALNRSYDETYEKKQSKKKSIVYDYDLDELNEKAEEAAEAQPVEPEIEKPALDPKNTSADAVFASDFDPFKLVMSDEMANKPSSKSAPIAQPTRSSLSCNDSISDITEDDILRAKRQEEFERKKAERLEDFERRKAALTGRHNPEPKQPQNPPQQAQVSQQSQSIQEASVAATEPTVTIEIEEAADAIAPTVTETVNVFNYYSEEDAKKESENESAEQTVKEPEEPIKAEDQKPARTYFHPAYSPLTQTEQGNMDAGSADENDARAAFRRAAAFSTAAMCPPTEVKVEDEKPVENTPSSVNGETVLESRARQPLAYTFEVVADEEIFPLDSDDTDERSELVYSEDNEQISPESEPATAEAPMSDENEHEDDNTCFTEDKEQSPIFNGFGSFREDNYNESDCFSNNDYKAEKNTEQSKEDAVEQAIYTPRKPVRQERYETLNDAGIPIIDRGVPLDELYPREEENSEPDAAKSNNHDKVIQKDETPDMQEALSNEEGGLVFEFDSMKPTPPTSGGPRTLVTERILYTAPEQSSEAVEETPATVQSDSMEQIPAKPAADVNNDLTARKVKASLSNAAMFSAALVENSADCDIEDEAEDEEFIPEFDDEEVVECDNSWCENEIPPEQQNPEVAEMRDMFTALRKENEKSEEAEEIEEDPPAQEDIPYFDTFLDDPTDDEDEVEEYEDGLCETECDDDLPPFDIQDSKPADDCPQEKKKPDFSNYQKPPIELLGRDKELDDEQINAEIQENIRIIIETLASFNVTASIKGVDRGPRITRYEVVPARGVKVQAITHLFDDITLNLAVEGIRMEAPIPGKSAIGIEIPNKHSANVRLRELIECDEFANAKSTTFVCIGKDVAGNPVFGDIAKFPHALVAGATGMGKSVSINSIMISMLYKSRPDQVKFIMIDPKKVEFRMYSGIPHLLIPVITEAKQAAGALMWAVEEMERRYDLIEKMNIRNIEAYNERQAVDPSIGEHMPKIIIVIDELNDLMMQVRDPVEDLIMRIAQKARAAGIHLIIGTQRPDVKVITGTIKANINTRISCKVTSVVDSRTILEMAGAEKLLNRGDMLFKPVDKTKPIRVQGAFVSDSEVENIMNFLKAQTNGEQYDEEIFAEINKAAQKCGNKKSSGAGADDLGGDDDEDCGYYGDQKFLDAVELAIRSGRISTALLQRKLSIGYGRAAKYIDHMEEIGVVSEPNGQKAREVYLTMDEWREKLARVNGE